MRRPKSSSSGNAGDVDASLSTRRRFDWTSKDAPYQSAAEPRVNRVKSRSTAVQAANTLPADVNTPPTLQRNTSIVLLTTQPSIPTSTLWLTVLKGLSKPPELHRKMTICATSHFRNIIANCVVKGRLHERHSPMNPTRCKQKFRTHYRPNQTRWSTQPTAPIS